MSSAGVEPGRVRSTEGGEEAPRLTDRDPDTHRHQRTGDETLADPSRAAPCAQARRERGERSFGASQRYEPAQSLDTRTVFRYLLRSSVSRKGSPNDSPAFAPGTRPRRCDWAPARQRDPRSISGTRKREDSSRQAAPVMRGPVARSGGLRWEGGISSTDTLPTMAR